MDDAVRLPSCSWLPLMCGVALAAGCATLPSDRTERALYTDLRKAVELSEYTGWVVDRVQFEANSEHALRSVCQVPHADRNDLEAWLSGRIALAGGTAEAQYRDTGTLDGLSTRLTLERTRGLLRYADAHSAADCPFWLEPDPEFIGVQGDENRAMILLESQGYGALIFEGEDAALGGGGAGRLLVGHGLGPRTTLAAGAELGGTGSFVRNDRGTRRIETRFTGALPVLLRFTHFSRVLDVELAPTIRLDPDRSLLPPGGRIAVGGGLTTMRNTAFMPHFVLWAGYEFYPARDGVPWSHSVRVGTRVGIDWDP